MLSEIFQRTNTTGSQLERNRTIKTFQIQQVISRLLIAKAFFLSQRQGGQCVFSAFTQGFNGWFIQTVNFQQLFHWHVGQFFQRRETFFNQHSGEVFVNVQVFGEGIDRRVGFSLMLGLKVINGHHVEFPAAQL